VEEFNEIEEFKRAYIEKYNESPEAASKWVHDLLFDMRLKHENKMVSFKIGGLKAPGKDK
jgi:hypothetical protein